ncbi:MAG TPA: T9SS type A sorting domain-containing protein [Saprospiraceae bacterium]|nr:T9SS type A sorting domain-containing protein [Saprospiraceae bacterium]HNT19572.1 T9SS type A sorting domain-containing protein [Saprospiraceae bacterium]
MSISAIGPVFSQGNSCNTKYPSCYSFIGNPFSTNHTFPCWKLFLSDDKINIIDISFTQPDFGFILSNNSIYQYQNSSSTNIYKLPFEIFSTSRIYFINAKTGYVIANYFNGFFIIKTTDGGLNWSLVYSNTLISESIRSIYFHNENKFFIGLDRSILIFKDDKLEKYKNKIFSSTVDRLVGICYISNTLIIASQNELYYSKEEPYNTLIKYPNFRSNIHFLTFSNNQLFIYVSNGLYRGEQFDKLIFNKYLMAQETSPGIFAVLDTNTFWMGDGLSIDGGCTANHNYYSFDRIITFGHHGAIGLYHKNLYNYSCNNSNRIYDAPIYSQNILLPEKDSFIFNFKTDLTSHYLSNLPLPSCWLSSKNLDYPYFYYFKGNGKSYSFRVTSNAPSQVAILSGNISCLKEKTCSEINVFNKNIYMVLNTIENDDYYILIDHSIKGNGQLIVSNQKTVPLKYLQKGSLKADIYGDIISTQDDNKSTIYVYTIDGKLFAEKYFYRNINLREFNLAKGLYFIVVRSGMSFKVFKYNSIQV